MRYRSLRYGLLPALGLAAFLQFGPLCRTIAAQQPSPPFTPGTTQQPHLFHPQSWYEEHQAAGKNQTGGTIFSPTDNLPPGPGALLPGFVMHTTKVFLIFWTPNNTITTGYESLLQRFVQDVGGTPYLNILTQYYDNSLISNNYIQNVVTFGGSYIDTSTAYNAYNSADLGTPASPLQDSDIQSEVDHAISVNSWPTGNGNLFAVFTEKGIESCDGSGNCTPLVPGGNEYCAYHNWYNILNNRIYANMPFVNSTGWDCNNTSGQPNSAIDGDADYEISTFSHEMSEAITDPYPNATWTDGNCSGGVVCGEIGDKCAYNFHSGQTNADGSNLTLHGNPYNTQPEWSNATFTALGGVAGSGCTHAYLPADMDITKSGPPSAFAGSTFDYTIDVKSNTAPTAETPHFTDPLNASLQFEGISIPAGWACNTPTVGAGGSIDCFRTDNALANDGFMNSGDTASFDVNVRVTPSTPDGSVVGNTGTITWDGKYAADYDSASNVHLSKTSSTSATVTASADMTISKSALGLAYAGANFSYAIDVENNGPSDAQSVSVSDTLPSGTTLVSVTPGGGYTCTGSGPVTCTEATVGAGAIASITVTVHIPSGAIGTITDTATVSSTTSDPNPGNNTTTVTATVNTKADLALTKTGPSAPIAGNNVSYTLTGTNLGPSDAQTVSVSDTLPAGTTFVSLAVPSGWSCTTPPVGMNGPISCTTATVVAGAAATFTLVVHLSPSVANGSQLCNGASISSATLDPLPSNNSSQTCGTVQSSADLALTQTASKIGSPGNGTATFALTVTNNGPSDSQNISLVANSSLFTGPAPKINTTTGGTCTVGVSTVTCTWASLAFGASANVTISDSWRSAVGSVCDSGTVSAGTPDPNATNNSSTVCIAKK